MTLLKTKLHNLVRFLAVSNALSLALSLTTAIPSPAQTFNTLVSFDRANGWSPAEGMSLVQGRDGNYYGTTSGGGAVCNGAGCGTVFRITSTGTLTTLYGFCSQPNCIDGGSPRAGLVLASDGNFYGTANRYGPNGTGTVFKVTSTGTLTTLYSFCSRFNCADGAEPWGGLIQATDGKLYGTTWGGGAGYYGTIFRITPPRKPTTIYNFCDLPCPEGPRGELVQATDGNFYGITAGGGPSNDGAVFKTTPGGKLTTLHTFCSQPNCTDGDGPLEGLVQATDGSLYGTTYGGGTFGWGAVFKITPAGKLTTLYSFCSQPNCTDGGNPISGLAQATDGNFYGTTARGGSSGSGCGGYGCGTIFEVTPSGTLTTLHSFYGTDGNDPGKLVQATDGNFYGTTSFGGAFSCSGYGCGTIFRLATGLGPFVSLLPTTAKVGQTVGILGQGFNTTTSVMFGSGLASFTIVSDTYLTAVVPAEGTTGYVNVTTGSGTLTSNTIFRVVPIITGFNPSSGPVGTQVTITGGGFNGATRVTIGGFRTTFKVNSGSQITATVPIRARTDKKVIVLTPGGKAISNGTFTVT
jgi:uncharacterized repeat protein (TIGR03803 family)